MVERGLQKGDGPKAEQSPHPACDGDSHFPEQDGHFWDGQRDILKENGSIYLWAQSPPPPHTLTHTFSHTFLFFFFSPRELFATK